MPRKKKEGKASDVEFRSNLAEDATKKLTTLESAMLARKVWSDLLGQTFGGDRDIYEELGYKRNPTQADYKRRFERQDIARTLVTAYPDACWRDKPEVREDDAPEDTEFEKAFKQHAQETNLWNYLHRLDIIAGIGQFGIMLYGLDGTDALKLEAVSSSKVHYIKLYFQTDAEITGFEKSTKSPRYDMPTLYKIEQRKGNQRNDADKSSVGQDVEVHHSRILHVADGLLDSDIYGTPRLQAVHNRLEDLEKILGASAEGYWKKAFPGAAFIKDADADWGTSESDMEDEIEEYYHKFTRWMRLSGMDIHEFESKIEDPTKHMDIQLMILSAASRIPLRILTGSERGELASSQDETSWKDRIDERRKNFISPMIITRHVQKMIDLKVLPEPKAGFTIDWPDVHQLSQKDQAEVTAKKATAMKDYSAALEKGFDMVIPPYYFLVDFLGVDEDRASEYQQETTRLFDEEEEEAKQARKAEEE